MIPNRTVSEGATVEEGRNLLGSSNSTFLPVIPAATDPAPNRTKSRRDISTTLFMTSHTSLRSRKLVLLAFRAKNAHRLTRCALLLAGRRRTSVDGDGKSSAS